VRKSQCGKKWEQGEGFESALNEVAEALGKQLAKDAKPGSKYTKVTDTHGAQSTNKNRTSKTPSDATQELDFRELIDRYALVADFTLQLCPRTERKVGKPSYNRLRDFFRVLIVGLNREATKNGSTSAGCKISTAVAFDCFFLLYGITPQNEAEELSLLTKEFDKHHLHIGEQALAEVRYMANNYYNQFGNTFSTISKRLASMTKLASQPFKRKQDTHVPFISALASGGNRNSRVDNLLQTEPAYLSSRPFDPFRGNKDSGTDKSQALSLSSGISNTTGKAKSRAGSTRTPAAAASKTSSTPAARRPFFDVGGSVTNKSTERQAHHKSKYWELYDDERLAEEFCFFRSGGSARGGAKYLSSGAADTGMELANLSSGLSELPAAPGGGPNQINCGSLLEFHSTEDCYKYGFLRVTPGLQHVLWQRSRRDGSTHHFELLPCDELPKEALIGSAGNILGEKKQSGTNAQLGDSRNDSEIFHNTNASGRSRGGGNASEKAKLKTQKGRTVVPSETAEIYKVFANNGDCYKFVSGTAGSILQCYSASQTFHMMKSNRDEWMPIVAHSQLDGREVSVEVEVRKGKPEMTKIKDHRHLLCALLFNRGLCGIEFQPLAYQILHILFWAISAHVYQEVQETSGKDKPSRQSSLDYEKVQSIHEEPASSAANSAARQAPTDNLPSDEQQLRRLELWNKCLRQAKSVGQEEVESDDESEAADESKPTSLSSDSMEVEDDASGGLDVGDGGGGILGGATSEDRQKAALRAFGAYQEAERIYCECLWRLLDTLGRDRKPGARVNVKEACQTHFGKDDFARGWGCPFILGRMGTPIGNGMRKSAPVLSSSGKRLAGLLKRCVSTNRSNDLSQLHAVLKTMITVNPRSTPGLRLEQHNRITLYRAALKSREMLQRIDNSKKVVGRSIQDEGTW
jgi:hypothetical protein